MRLLMTTDTVGGLWTYALDLAAALSQCGIATILAVLGPVTAAHLEDAAAVPGLEPIDTGLPLDWAVEEPDAAAGLGAVLAALARSRQADIVQVNSPTLAADAGFDVPLVVACHSCVATWWQAVRGGPLPPDFARQAERAGRGLRAADVVIAPTRAFAADTAATYGLAALPVAVHNGRRVPPAASAQAPAPTFAFTAGRLWDEGKGIATLDRAAGNMALPVLAAGPVRGPNGAAIVLDHTVGLGPLRSEEVAAHLRLKPIFVSPASYEPFGLAVLEAAQAGCPLVLADIPTFRELWEGAAAFVPPGNAETLAGVCERIAADPAVARRLGDAAQARAARYRLDATAARMAAIYRSIAARPPEGMRRAV